MLLVGLNLDHLTTEVPTVRACPWEMLHALLLGTCKHVRDCFFNQLGETSQKSDDVNALAVELGRIIMSMSDLPC